MPGAALQCVRPSGHDHEPKYSVTAFWLTCKELRVAGESDSISIEKHHGFKRKCNREVPEGRLGCLCARRCPSLRTPRWQRLQNPPLAAGQAFSSLGESTEVHMPTTCTGRGVRR